MRAWMSRGNRKCGRSLSRKEHVKVRSDDNPTAAEHCSCHLVRTHHQWVISHSTENLASIYSRAAIPHPNQGCRSCNEVPLPELRIEHSSSKRLRKTFYLGLSLLMLRTLQSMGYWPHSCVFYIMISWLIQCGSRTLQLNCPGKEDAHCLLPLPRSR